MCCPRSASLDALSWARAMSGHVASTRVSRRSAASILTSALAPCAPMTTTSPGWASASELTWTAPRAASSAAASGGSMTGPSSRTVRPEPACAVAASRQATTACVAPPHQGLEPASSVRAPARAAHSSTEARACAAASLSCGAVAAAMARVPPSSCGQVARTSVASPVPAGSSHFGTGASLTWQPRRRSEPATSGAAPQLSTPRAWTPISRGTSTSPRCTVMPVA